MYLTQRERLLLQAIERAIYKEFGIDKDTYMYTTSIKHRVMMPRCIYIHEVYVRTNMTLESIAERLKRHHSSIVRSVQRVERWKQNPQKYEKQLGILNRIKNEIEQTIMA